MKKILITTIFATAVAMSGVLGISITAHAGNTSDIQYMFHNTGTSGNTPGREKQDSTKVYIHPSSGPVLKYTVQGFGGSTWVKRSNSYTVPNGTQASFTNYVYEHSELYARLHLERTVYANTHTYGKWSPDSTKNYTVYN